MKPGAWRLAAAPDAHHKTPLPQCGTQNRPADALFGPANLRADYPVLRDGLMVAGVSTPINV